MALAIADFETAPLWTPASCTPTSTTPTTSTPATALSLALRLPFVVTILLLLSCKLNLA